MPTVAKSPSPGEFYYKQVLMSAVIRSFVCRYVYVLMAEKEQISAECTS